MTFGALTRRAFHKQALLPLALAAGSGMATLFGSTQAHAQVPEACLAGLCGNNSSVSDANQRAYVDGLAEQWYKSHPGDRPKAATQQSTVANPYINQAQTLFATDANGHYKNPHVGEIVNNTIKLYDQAAANGFALRPGLYAPMKQYFNGLNAKDQDIALVAFMPSLDKAAGFNSSTIVSEYAEFLEKINSGGQSSIVARFRYDVLLRPKSDPRSEIYKIAVASVLGVKYPVQPVIALNAQPGGR